MRYSKSLPDDDNNGNRDSKSSYRVCTVGSGTRFLSGISYYTLYLANALAQTHHVSTILMRQLLPTWLYPGRKRVGYNLTSQAYRSEIKVFDGVDWFWFPSILGAIRHLLDHRPEIVIFQWWTGTVLHTYILLALLAHLLRAKVIIEFHEIQDTGEARLKWARFYVQVLMPFLRKLAHGFVVHSRYDLARLEALSQLNQCPVEIIPHGPYEQYNLHSPHVAYREAPADCCNLLFFGIIRPYKGVEDLITAFNEMPKDEVEKYWLTIVGETWEGWTIPLELIEKSPWRNRITLVSGYLPDEEVARYFAGADAVVLPYHRSSASGPLHAAMAWGLPIVVTRVGGLPEAVEEYKGAVLVPPQDPKSLRNALSQMVALRGQRFTNPHSWQLSAAKYGNLFANLYNAEVEDRKVTFSEKVL